jgi:hypothetical protein
MKARGAVDQEAKENIQKVLALPFEEVKQHALELIHDPRRFRNLTDDLSENPEVEKLGPILQDFFSHFESVTETNGDFSVARGAVSMSSLRAGFLKIGTDYADSELVVRPGEDRVFIVTDSEHKLDGLPTIYRSRRHLKTEANCEAKKSRAVGKFMTTKTSNFQAAQQLSTNGQQQVQYQSLKNLIFQ